jgi:pimeloyl-ACP methyl ester carboxylesterase
MVALSTAEEYRQKRRKRLLRALLFGGAAVGIPAAANAIIARRNRRLGAPGWGRTHRYAWKFGEIAFQRLGSGTPLVCLHSFGPGHDAEEWHDLAEGLASRFEVFVPDFLGWGRSAKPRLPYDGELYIGQVADFLEDVVASKAVVLAAGLGAAYAVQVALDRPQMIQALGLAVPSGIALSGEEPDVKDALVNRMLQLPVVGTSALNLYTSRSAIAAHLRRDAYFAADRADAGRIEHHYQSSHQPGSHLALAAFLSGYLNHRIDENLARLDTPTWIAWGRQATMPPVEVADLWLSRLPQAELEVFEGTSNLPHAEVPARFQKPLEGFLARRSAQAIPS